MKKFAFVIVAGAALAGCNAGSGVDMQMAAYTSCLDQQMANAPRGRAARQAAMNKAFEACKGQEQALTAASSQSIGATAAAKATADGKAAYARRMVAAR